MDIYDIYENWGNNDWWDWAALVVDIAGAALPFIPAAGKLLKGASKVGLEYLGTDGNWYHESVLKEFLRGGSPNPIFNEDAARMTHIPLGGKQ